MAKTSSTAQNGSKMEVAMVEMAAEVMGVLKVLLRLLNRIAILKIFLTFFLILKKTLKLEGSAWSRWIRNHFYYF